MNTISRRAAYLVYIDLDPKPGMMHSQESVQNVIRNVLFQSIGCQKPTVSLAPRDLQHPFPEVAATRRAFMVYVDLDPEVGAMADEGSTLRTIYAILWRRMSRYDPQVYIASEYVRTQTTKGKIAA